jgi:hypothetical protein
MPIPTREAKRDKFGNVLACKTNVKERWTVWWEQTTINKQERNEKRMRQREMGVEVRRRGVRWRSVRRRSVRRRGVRQRSVRRHSVRRHSVRREMRTQQSTTHNERRKEMVSTGRRWGDTRRQRHDNDNKYFVPVTAKRVVLFRRDQILHFHFGGVPTCCCDDCNVPSFWCVLSKPRPFFLSPYTTYSTGRLWTPFQAAPSFFLFPTVLTVHTLLTRLLTN